MKSSETDPRSCERNLCNCIRSLKKFRTSAGFETVTLWYKGKGSICHRNWCICIAPTNFSANPLVPMVVKWLNWNDVLFSAWAGRRIALFARNCHAKTSVLHESKWYQNLETRTEQISFVLKVRAAQQKWPQIWLW